MSITSFTFILFVFAVMIVYYLIPRKWQWTVLLAASCIFYLMGGKKAFLFVLITAASVYFAARLMQNMSDGRKAYLKEHKKELSKEENKGKLVFYAGMDKVRFKKQVVPGDQLIMTAKFVKRRGTIAVVEAKAEVDGKLAASGTLTFAIGS